MSITYEVLNYNKNGKLFLIMILQNPVVFVEKRVLIFIQKGGLYDYEYSIPSWVFNEKCVSVLDTHFPMNLMLLLILKFSKKQHEDIFIK